MPHLKGFGKFLLAFVVVTALIVLAFAAETEPQTGKLTVENATEGSTYKVYQIFKPGMSAQYEVTEQWEGYVRFERGRAYYISGSGLEDWEEITESSAAESLQALADLAESNDIECSKAVTAQGGTAVFESLPYGYYLLIPDNGVGGIFPLDEQDKRINQNNAADSTPEKKIPATGNGREYTAA